MLTKHVKINQLDVKTGKTSSNNDIILIDQQYSISYKDHHTRIITTPHNINDLCQGFFYAKTNLLEHIIVKKEKDTLSLSLETPKKKGSLTQKQITKGDIDQNKIIELNRRFKTQQTLYHQTGATESLGIVLDDFSILTIECTSIISATYKILGQLIRQNICYIPIILMSHKPSIDTLKTLQLLNPSIMINQSSIASSALEHIISNKITYFGFCRKTKYNRYTNFHL